MGSFITNLHVFTEGIGAPDSAVVGACAKVVAASGDLVVDSSTDKPAREIIVAPVNGPWVTLVDESIDQNVEALDELARGLSIELKTWVLGVLVHDSDCLVLRLHKAGELVDAFNSAPGLFAGELTAEAEREAAGHPARWKPLLAPDSTPQDLKKALARESTFAEHLLADIASLLRLSDDDACLSARHLDEYDADRVAQLKHVRFRAVPRPATNQSSLRFKASTDGITADIHAGGDGDHSPGESGYVHPSFVLADDGTLSGGFTIEFSGSALEQRLLTMDNHTIRLIQVETSGGRLRYGETELNVPPNSNSSGSTLRYEFASPRLPALKPFPGRANAAMMAQVKPGTTVGLGAIGMRVQYIAEGQGDLIVRITPHQNIEGSATRHYRFNIAPPPALGFPAAATKNSYRALRRLQAPRLLLASALFESPLEQLTPHLAAAFEAWSVHLAGPKPIRWGALGSTIREMAKLESGGVAAWPQWKGMTDKFADQTWFHAAESPRAHEVRPIGSPPSPPGHGFGFNIPKPGFVQVGLWLRIGGRTEEALAASEERLAATLDEFSRNSTFSHAFVARWDWAPAYPPSGNVTPYEDAHLGLLGRSNVTVVKRSRVRAVTDRMWVGQPIRNALDRSALETVSDVEEQGAVWKLSLRPGSTLADLERALSPVLPTLLQTPSTRLAALIGNEPRTSFDACHAVIQYAASHGLVSIPAMAKGIRTDDALRAIVGKAKVAPQELVVAVAKEMED